MKDYTLEKEEQSEYIVDYAKKESEQKESIVVKFADGTYLKNIEFCPENLKKIEEIQEKQAAKGIESLPVFKKKSGKITSMALITGIGIASISSLCFTPEDIMIQIAGVGAITLFTMSPFACKLAKNKEKIRELEKLKYRNEHQETLSSIKKYHNSLNGLSKKSIKRIQTEENPFSILHVDDYKKEDLERIVANIEKEKKYPFTYVKKSKEKK